jgi:ABC-type multidrug transport system fused ATPase/permease subunit
MVVVTLLGMLLFDVPFTGNVAAFTLGAALFLFVVLGIGVFISTISVTVGQAIQTAFFFLLPQILLSGFIFPLDAIPWGVRWISYLLPLTYFTQISQGIMLRGAPIDSLWLPFLALTLMAVVVFAGAVLRFRRSLTPGDVSPSARGAGMTAGTVFGADEVTVQFGEVTAVDGVSVTAEPGAVTAVVGGDGAGKTTLLRAVVGRVMPTRGRITAPSPAQVGYQPASGGSWADLTVSQNMQFVGTTYGLRGTRAG